ncbi:Zinc-finger of C2H2 type [Sesbania bispinosa]|nr:Zinc-finger of C2H2 type [Sesbania bispinosa]
MEAMECIQYTNVSSRKKPNNSVTQRTREGPSTSSAAATSVAQKSGVRLREVLLTTVRAQIEPAPSLLVWLVLPPSPFAQIAQPVAPSPTSRSHSHTHSPICLLPISDTSLYVLTGLQYEMIKRRFYKLDYGDREAVDPSSSSSEDDDAIAEVKQDDDEVGSTSSGYESEDSSADDVDVNSAGLLSSEDDAGAINERHALINRELPSKLDSEKSNILAEKKTLPIDMPSYVLKCKSVFKCRICPRIICLTEDTLRDHLQSKRHARSEKLHLEGRLKAMLNSDGEIETQEVSEIQTKDTEDNAKKEGKKQRKKRFRKKKSDKANTPSTKESAKRRRKK